MRKTSELGVSTSVRQQGAGGNRTWPYLDSQVGTGARPRAGRALRFEAQSKRSGQEWRRSVIGPPKQKRAPAKSALQKLQLQTAYHALDLVQAPFGLVFWKIEQLKGRLQDRIDNEGSDL